MTNEPRRNPKEPVPPLKQPSGPDKGKQDENKRTSPGLVQVEGDSPRRGP
jgi:hypothetical protein